MHQEEIDQYPEDFKQDSARLVNWLVELADRYGDQIHIRVIDPQSPEGLLKSVRYWVRRYPTFIVDGRQKVTGWDQAQLDEVLQARLTGR